jgi:hypothetical protein
MESPLLETKEEEEDGEEIPPLMTSWSDPALETGEEVAPEPEPEPVVAVRPESAPQPRILPEVQKPEASPVSAGEYGTAFGEVLSMFRASRL